MMGFSQQSRIYFTAYGALVCCCFGFYPFASHLPVCFLSVVFNGMPFWLHKIGWYTALMKMLDKCSFLELTSGMLYKTFLNMLAAALSVMKSWKLEVLLSLCGQLRTVFSALPSFAVNFERNYFSWNFLGPLCNVLIIPSIRKIILIFWSTIPFLGLCVMTSAFFLLHHVKSFFLHQEVFSLEKTDNSSGSNAHGRWNPFPLQPARKCPQTEVVWISHAIFRLILCDTLILTTFLVQKGVFSTVAMMQTSCFASSFSCKDYKAAYERKVRPAAGRKE